MTITPDKVIRSGFTENLGSDLIAVNAAGHVIGRASTREALDRACPDAAAVFTGADLAPVDMVEAQTTALDGPFAAVMAQVDPKVLEDYIPTNTVLQFDGPEEPPFVAPAVDGSAFDHDKDGHVGGSRPKANRQRKPIK